MTCLLFTVVMIPTNLARNQALHHVRTACLDRNPRRWLRGVDAEPAAGDERNVAGLAERVGRQHRYKSVINARFALALGDGLALERKRARAFNARIRADEVEQRREAVRARNRSAA